MKNFIFTQIFIAGATLVKEPDDNSELFYNPLEVHMKTYNTYQ